MSLQELGDGEESNIDWPTIQSFSSFIPDAADVIVSDEEVEEVFEGQENVTLRVEDLPMTVEETFPNEDGVIAEEQERGRKKPPRKSLMPKAVFSNGGPLPAGVKRGSEEDNSEPHAVPVLPTLVEEGEALTTLELPRQTATRGGRKSLLPARGKETAGRGRKSLGPTREATGKGKREDKDEAGKGKDVAEEGKDVTGKGKDATGKGKVVAGKGKDATEKDKDAAVKGRVKNKDAPVKVRKGQKNEDPKVPKPAGERKLKNPVNKAKAGGKRENKMGQVALLEPGKDSVGQPIKEIQISIAFGQSGVKVSCSLNTPGGETQSQVLLLEEGKTGPEARAHRNELDISFSSLEEYLNSDDSLCTCSSCENHVCSECEYLDN